MSLAAYASTVQAIAEAFSTSYAATPKQLRILDAFSLCAAATALVLAVYAKLVGSFPFNAYLAGLFACVGSMVLTVGLRMQVDPSSKDSRPAAAAFGGYAFAMVTLFLAAWNYVG
eukprot:scaffold5.g682.t1